MLEHLQKMQQYTLTKARYRTRIVTPILLYNNNKEIN